MRLRLLRWRRGCVQSTANESSSLPEPLNCWYHLFDDAAAASIDATADRASNILTLSAAALSAAPTSTPPQHLRPDFSASR